MAKFRMDVDQKRYFCALCSAGSITEAAQSLYISRQGLSKSMKNLENQVGVQLFTRSKSGVGLTEAGRILLRYIREEDKLWDACLVDMRAASESVPESIRVGLLSMYVGYEQKRELFARFNDDPSMKIEVVDGDHDAFWQAIAAGDMEFAFTMSPPEDMGLPVIKLANDVLSILLSVEDPLARKSHIDFETDLRGKTVIQTSPYKGRLFETAFKNYGIETELLLHDKNLMLARVSTSEDCFIIQSEYAKSLVTDQVCMKPLINAPFDMDSSFVFRSDLSRSAQVVARELLAPYGKQGEFDAFLGTSETSGGEG